MQKKICVVDEHVTKNGEAKLIAQCTFPRTGVNCVTHAYTSHAVVDGHFVLWEKLGSLSFANLQAMTSAKLRQTCSEFVYSWH